MLLIVGLGNPGSRYAGNRHNIGFMAVDRIHALHRFGPWRSKFQSEIAEGTLGDRRTLLMKPLTYMNESGRAVGEASRFLKIPPADIVVLHDELDLPAAKLRVKTGGGHGGHNGLRSLDAHLGKEYRRVRLGIGHPGDKALVHNYVLGDFAKVDAEWLDPLLDAVATQAPLLAAGSDETFASKVHLAIAPPPRRQKPADAAAAAGKPAAGKPSTIRPPEAAPGSQDAPRNAIADALGKLLGKS
ncbi:aminoacyl-tRNA hydrolase [Methylobrevis albus]|uniref:Peptidyl-tRNA hydrolase n=1 Tax=Methylobrevis albus TaxID=2793297 RepID=A0A931I4F8_9HYPH|nr:aminoacyl-tRNA hydrolase [Methylobrevis albus]MBH0239299.1 aminoacyl-tRNA hydrolase [Methylobrevis albus]